MKHFWSQIPLVKITACLVAGIGVEIALAVLWNKSKEGLYLFLFLLFITTTFEIIYRQLNVVKQFRFRYLNATLWMMAYVALGYVLTWFHTAINGRNHFGHFLNSGNFMTITLTQTPVIKDKTMTVVGEVNALYRDGQKLSGVNGQILLNLMRDNRSEQLAYGDKIVCYAKVETFAAPQNPEEFNFKLYQSFHNVFHRAFLRAHDWQLLSRNNGNPILSCVYWLRARFLHILQTYLHKPNDFAVASAMLLGYRDFMGDDLIQAYSGTGALHVLCVSGLHVGIVFVLLNALLKWADRRGQKWKIAKAACIVSFIWGYALLTGLSPSVMRAATMFTMIQTGKVFYRYVNIYNVIAGSILVLILFNPYVVTEIGFRLSYLAVIGIIYLQPKIYTLLPVRHWLPDKAWQITSVSIAAQIATFPIGLYYFHQFPSLFLVSNLVVIPASTILLFTGIALFVCSWIPYVNVALGFLLAKSIGLLNQFIFWVTTIPHSLIYGISITMAEMTIIYLFFISVCFFIALRRPKMILAALLFLVVLSALLAGDAVRHEHSRQLVVYSVRGERAVAFICKRQVWYSFDHQLLNNRSAMLFHVQHHWWHCGVKQELPADSISMPLPFGSLVYFEHKTILMIDDTVKPAAEDLPVKLKVDYVVLSHNAKVYLRNLSRLVDFHSVIFDSSNNHRRIYYWKKDCEQLGVRYWDVNTQGAFIASL